MLLKKVYLAESYILISKYNAVNIGQSRVIYYGSDYSPRSGANSYKAGNDDVFSLFHAETD